MHDLKAENFSPHFPTEIIKVDLAEVDRRWSALVERHPELATPCFTCQFFYECNSGAKHDPITCEFLLQWFQRETTKTET